MAEILTPKNKTEKVFQKKNHSCRYDTNGRFRILVDYIFMLATSFSKPNVMDLGLPAGGQEKRNCNRREKSNHFYYRKRQ